MTPICSASLSFSSASLSERIGPICEASSKWSNVYEDLISTLCPLISSLLLYIQQDHHQSSSITILVIKKNIFANWKIITIWIQDHHSPHLKHHESNERVWLPQRPQHEPSPSSLMNKLTLQLDWLTEVETLNSAFYQGGFDCKPNEGHLVFDWLTEAPPQAYHVLGTDQEN